MDLTERLADVASEVADVRPPVGLWDREVRRRTRARRNSVVAVLVACLAVAGLLAGSWHAARQPDPAAPRGRVTMPDQVFQPSRWLQGTDQAGELGRLIAITITERATWLGERPAVLGVSANTGAYRFLDLPDLADPKTYPIALSPDGLHVAFWTVEPSTDNAAGAGQGPVTGFAVYDVVTGEVRRAPVHTSYEPDSLFFVDARTVVALYGRFASEDHLAEDASHPAPALLWDLAAPHPEQVSLPEDVRPMRPAARDGRLWTSWGVRHGSVLVQLIDGISGRHLGGVTSVGGFSGLGSEGALSPDGTRLAVLPGPKAEDLMSTRVTLYDLTPRRGCCGPGQTLDGLGRTHDVVSWLGDNELLLLQFESDASLPHGEFRDELVAVDIRDGSTRVVTRFPTGGNNGGSWMWAQDLLDSPSAPGVPPPRPWDPRVTTALVALVLGASGLFIRSRRRRRGRP